MYNMYRRVNERFRRKEEASKVIQTTHSNTPKAVTSVLIYVLMRDEKEGRKKRARSNKQQGKATQHTQGSHFSKCEK